MSLSPPSIATCLQMMEEYAMLPNIREHSFVVGRVSEAVYNKLATSGKSPDLPPLDLVVAGALLHDIAKTKCLAEGCDHAKVGAEICLQHGFTLVAEIVREHVLLKIFEEERYQKGVFLAKELIFYCDKRVMHDAIVTLSERLDYILERYGNNDPARYEIIRLNFERCQNLERWLCKFARCSVTELLDDLNLAPYTEEMS